MKDMVTVKNRGASVVGYKIAESGVRRVFAPGESKSISIKELEELTYQPGGIAILTNFLQVQDDLALQAMGAKVEPEYHMSENDIIKLVQTGSLDAFLDALDFAPIGVIDLIKKYSVQLPLLDMSKRKALKEKTGFDVEAAIKHMEEEKEDEGGNTILKQAPSERRVKEEAPAGRRTTPTYNVVKKAETSAE